MGIRPEHAAHLTVFGELIGGRHQLGGIDGDIRRELGSGKLGAIDGRGGEHGGGSGCQDQGQKQRFHDSI